MGYCRIVRAWEAFCPSNSAVAVSFGVLPAASHPTVATSKPEQTKIQFFYWTSTLNRTVLRFMRTSHICASNKMNRRLQTQWHFCLSCQSKEHFTDEHASQFPVANQSLTRNRNWMISSSAGVWRSKPQLRRKNVVMLSDLHVNCRRRSVQSQTCSFQSVYQYVSPNIACKWYMKLAVRLINMFEPDCSCVCALWSCECFLHWEFLY
jgi:hypothetical protein